MIVLSKTGVGRIDKVVRSFKDNIQQLTIGIKEVTTKVTKNNDAVNVKREKFEKFKVDKDRQNEALQSSVDEAQVFLDNLKSLMTAPAKKSDKTSETDDDK